MTKQKKQPKMTKELEQALDDMFETPQGAAYMAASDAFELAHAAFRAAGVAEDLADEVMRATPEGRNYTAVAARELAKPTVPMPRPTILKGTEQ